MLRAAPQARMLVAHGHFNVNGRRTNIPSMQITPTDVISVREGSRTRTYFKGLVGAAEGANVPTWLTRDLGSLSGGLLRSPERAEIDGNLNEQLIVEYYSRT